jgi:hypothetical protein
MNVVGIFYPREFMSYSKFKRKITRLLSNLTAFDIVYESDDNSFISKFSDDTGHPIQPKQIECWKESNLTHAIIFDDGHTYPELRTELKKKQIICRCLGIKITTVINIKKNPEYQGINSTASYEYIGRGSYWGNPYSMFEKGENRSEVIRKYRYDFERDLFPNKDKYELHRHAGKKLGCFCKPEDCHGDILAEYLNGYDDGR